MDEVALHCLECGHQWSILCPMEIVGEEMVTKIGMYDDLCPLCEAQGELAEEEVEEEVT